MIPRGAVSVDVASPWESFRRGFYDTNPLILCVAAVLMLAATLGVRQGFSAGAWTRIPMNYWLRSPADDFIAVSWTVGALKRTPPDHQLVVLLGSSTAREAISDGAAVAAAVQDAGGPGISFYDLGSSSQNFGESLAIIDNLPAKWTTVLLGVNVNSFIFARHASFQQISGRELLLDSPTLRRFALSRGRTDRLGILPGVCFFFRTSWRTRASQLMNGQLLMPSYAPHFYDSVAPLSINQKRALASKWAQQNSSMFHANIDFNVSLLTELVRRTRQRGMDFVLVELPINADVAGESVVTATRRYRSLLRKVADGSGIVYLDFNQALRLDNRNFHDLSHLTRAGRDLWQQELGRNVASLFRSGAIGNRRH